MVQIVPPTGIVKTIPDVLLIRPFLPVTSAVRTPGQIFCCNWKDQTDMKVLLKLHGLFQSAGLINSFYL